VHPPRENPGYACVCQLVGLWSTRHTRHIIYITTQCCFSAAIVTAHRAMCLQLWAQLSVSSRVKRPRKQRECRDLCRVPCAPCQMTPWCKHNGLQKHTHTHIQVFIRLRRSRKCTSQLVEPRTFPQPRNTTFLHKSARTDSCKNVVLWGRGQLRGAISYVLTTSSSQMNVERWGDQWRRFIILAESSLHH